MKFFYLNKYVFCACYGLLAILCCLLSSCTKKEPAGVGLFTDYERETVSVKNKGTISKLEADEYKLKIEAHLALPDTSRVFLCDCLKFDGGYYFLKENGEDQSIWVFDSEGNYVSKLGQKGRARNEYQTEITDWFYIPEKNEISVFEKKSRAIHRFLLDGTSCETQILKSWPYAIGFLDNDKMFCSYYQKMAKEGTQLALLSKDEEVVANFINLQSDMKYYAPSDNSFYQSQERLYHIPCLSDSVIVFDKESVEKVVKFAFEDPIITDEIRKDAMDEKTSNLKHFKGIRFVNTFYETSDFYYLQYVFSGMYINQLIAKHTGKQYRFPTCLVKGLFPSTVFCVRGNKLFYLMTKENVDEKRRLIKLEDYDEVLSESDPLIQRIFNGEEPLPVVLSLEIVD